MAQTHGTVLPPKVVAQEIIAATHQMFPGLFRFVRNFSDQQLRPGQTLILHTPSVGEVVEHGAKYSDAVADVSMTDIPLALEKQYDIGGKITDYEQHTSVIALRENYIPDMARKVGAKMMAHIFAKIVTGTATPSVEAVRQLEVALGGFDRVSGPVEMRKLMRKRQVYDENRFMILVEDYYSALEGDLTAVANNTNAGAGNSIANGGLPKLSGFTVEGWDGLPNQDAPNHVSGIFGANAAIGVVTSIPPVPKDSARINGKISVVSDPDTGFAVQLREWYDIDAGEDVFVMTFNIGAAIIDSKRLFALTSATPTV